MTMQGKLTEIDIRSILQLIESGQRTGELYVESYPPVSPTLGHTSHLSSRQKHSYWLVCFTNGKITYAADQTHNTLKRLRDYLRRYQVDESYLQGSDLATDPTSTREYSCLWRLLEKGIITPTQGKGILQRMVEETLFDLLSLHQGQFTFTMGATLAPQLASWEIEPMVTKMMQEIQQWKQLHPFVESSTQCPILADEGQLQATLPTNTYKNLKHWADGKNSLRQLSRYLNRPLVVVAQGIYAYIQRDWVYLVDLPKEVPSETEATEVTELPRIVCLDDEPVVGKSVEKMLNSLACEIVVVEDAIAFLSESFRVKPDLLLCDITMPDLDGYQICAMLRSTIVFRQTPIIMLTGKEGYLDRVRARMVGATDYLTKPFSQDELITLVEKYLNLQPSNHPESSPALTTAFLG
jgi:twitching motility two-component system response regulator PilG